VDRPKVIWHLGVLVFRAINDYRYKKRFGVSHVVSAINRQSPLAAEVTFKAPLCSGRDDRDEQRAIVDLLPNLAVPDISASQLALVEPDFDASGTQSLTNPLGRLSILRGVTQKYRVR
jgi:hypothetical protein